MRIAKICLIVAGLLTCLTAWNQTTTNSPYSIYGLGDEGSRAFANQRAMGTAQIAHVDSGYVNFRNPATYASLGKPIFSADVNFDFLNVQAPASSQSFNNAYLSNIALAFPIGKRFGFAAGINPYTQMGYNIVANQYDSVIGNYDFVYQGDGGINQAMGGVSAVLWDTYLDTARRRVNFGQKKYINHRLSIGANVIYYFGFAQTSRAVTNFIDDPAHLSSKMKNKTNVNGAAFDFGLHYRLQMDSLSFLSVAGYYQPSLDISAKNLQVSYSYFPNNDVENIRDTVTSTEIDGQITFPSSMGGGISLELERRWTINMDYRMTNWSELKLFDTPQNLKNRTDMAFGLQYVPKHNAERQLLAVIRYRAGVRFSQTRLEVNNQQLQEYTVSLGLGLPILKSVSRSSLNVGIDFGQRGNNLSTGVNEQFTRVYFGVAFSPLAKQDEWFNPRKYE
ncbi:hypothetical protein KFE98_06255 [bacterium SCSIO 12741]|nr:hypothetical protein KFE98_06255 [bacterium SCSIO 12741]